MRRLLLPLLLVLIMGLVQACSRAVAPEEDCAFVQNSVGQRVSWGSQVPVKMNIHQNVPVQYHQAIRDAMEEWNKLVGKDVLHIGIVGVGGVVPTSRDAQNTIYMLDEWDEEKPNEQARTSVYWKGKQIIEADIRLNAKDFNFSAELEAELGKVDMVSLMVHELGHALGLAHMSHKESVMLTQLAKGEERRELVYGGPDFHAIKCEY